LQSDVSDDVQLTCPPDQRIWVRIKQIAAPNLTLALWQGAMLPPASTVAAAGVVGFLGDGVSLALFALGLRYLGTARMGAYLSLAPFVGAVLAVVMLGEPLSAQLIVAGGLMGFGLWLRRRDDGWPTHGLRRPALVWHGCGLWNGRPTRRMTGTRDAATFSTEVGELVWRILTHVRAV
jgi:hypothetical protein